ncbi:hypothetical protein DP117_28890 [Brasilonema sp. UFV-L1]|uniref:hypothetical protein n=1 Tax=Brasilonema sp. UFV-L1 TaxID=2234130 RepID=UPI0016B91720|nr:hypothetical protein [Brasilonema sp. UFV-L1]
MTIQAFLQEVYCLHRFKAGSQTATHDTSNSSQETQTSAHDILDVQTTNCCIVGGGPARAILVSLVTNQKPFIKIFDMVQLY